jgi:hypothetical protein
MTTRAPVLAGEDSGTDESHDDGAEPDAGVFHVMIAHDDYVAYVRAMRMLTTTFFNRAGPANIRLQPWRFDELARDVWRRRSLADAPRTAVFVVSASERGELPDGVNRWLSGCFSQRRQTPTAVIAVCDAVNDLEVPWRRRLREAAAAAGLDFLEAGFPATRKMA